MIRRRRILQGKTITGFTCNLSLINGTAFITNPSVNLRPYLGFKITLNDGTQNLVGWIKAAGTGETLGDELVVDPGFDDPSKWTAGAGWSVAGSLAVGASVINSVSIEQLLPITTTKNLYKISFDLVSRTSGSVSSYFLGSVSGFQTVPATYVGYYNLSDLYPTLYLPGQDSFSGTCDNASVKKVTDPSATGVTITSARAGATFNWTSDGGINPNATSFTATIARI